MVRNDKGMSRTVRAATCSACHKKWCWCDLDKLHHTCEQCKAVYSYFTELFNMNQVQHPPPMLCEPSLYCDDCDQLRACLEIIQSRMNS